APRARRADAVRPRRQPPGAGFRAAIACRVDAARLHPPGVRGGMSATPAPGRLKVLAPGLHTLLVDAGRPRARRPGVPVGGAADRFAHAVGNALVGNPPDTVALEINLSGPTLQASCDLACVVYGMPFTVRRDEHRLPAGTTFTLRAGETLTVGGS